MKLEIYNSVHTSESVPSRVNVWREKERDTHAEGENKQGTEGAGEEERDLISSADHAACGAAKSPEQNTTLNNELYAHNNIVLFSFRYSYEKGKWVAQYKINKNTAPKQQARINS